MVRLKNKYKGLSYKDIVVMLFVTDYPLKTARELSIITGCNYARLTQSLNKLLSQKKIDKTNTYPIKYMKNDY